MKQFTEEEHVSILADLIAIASVNEGEHEVALYLQKLLAAHDIDSDVIPVDGSTTRSNLFAKIGSGKPTIALSGHMDVVSAGNIDAWTSDPFTLREADGKLYGRGTNDMKAGLLNLVFAMIELKSEGFFDEHEGTIQLMATVGEEVGGAGARQFYQEGYMDDVDALWVTEPSVNDIIYAHKGSMNFRVDSYGEAAHSSLPELGYNAIDKLAEFINTMNERFRSLGRTNDILGDFVINTTVIEGGQQVNSIPESAHIEINARTVPELDNPEVKQIFQELEEAANAGEESQRIKVTCTMDLPSVFTDGASNFIRIMQRVGQEALGYKELPLIASTGVTDAASLLQGKDESFPFAMFGPGETRLAHKVDEYVTKDTYITFTQIVKQVCQQALQEGLH